MTQHRSLRAVVALAGAVATATGAGDAVAQTFPTKAVRVVVPFAPGGSTDVLARAVALRLTDAYGQQVTVDNRPGANTIVGADLVAKAPADGHTLLMTIDATFVINPHAYAKLPFDALKDFAPVTKVAALPLILVSHPSLPANDAKSFIALARSNPGKLDYSTSGHASTAHLSMLLLEKRIGTKMTHIAYKGGGQAVIDAIAGQVPLFMTAVPTVQQYFKSGKLKPIAFTSMKRHHSMPEVSTFAEAGLAGYDISIYYPIFAPAGTPRAAIMRVRDEVARILQLPEMKDRFLVTIGADPVGGTPEQLAADVKADFARWASIVKENGISIKMD
jgi:tripartite-type tricarboxylate transporter receptor subunit TctC